MLDPNIILQAGQGVTPFDPFGTAQKVMGLRQAQMQMQNQQRLRDLAAYNDLSTPEGQQALIKGYSQFDPLGAIKAQGEMAVTNQKIGLGEQERKKAELEAQKLEFDKKHAFAEAQGSLMQAGLGQLSKLAPGSPEEQAILKQVTDGLNQKAMEFGYYDPQHPAAQKQITSRDQLAFEAAKAMSAKDQLEQQKVEADRQFKESQLTEEGRHHQAMEGLARRKGGGVTSDGITIGGNSQPSQDQAVQDYKQALLEGRVPYPTARDLKDPVRMAGYRMALNEDPTYNASTHKIREKTTHDFSTGKQGDAVNALNTALGHLNELSDITSKLDNETGLSVYNAGKNFLKKNLMNDTDITAFNTVKKALADEATKVWRGTGGSEADVQAAMSNLDPSLSSAQLNRNIYEFSKLMASKQAALEDQYKKGMGNVGQRPSFLTDEAKAAVESVATRAGAKPATPKQAAPQASNSAPAKPPMKLVNLHSNGTQTIGWDGKNWVDSATGETVK